MKNCVEKQLNEFNMPAFNLAHYLLELNSQKKQSSRIAIKYKGHNITYKQLCEMVEYTAHYLMNCGVKKGDHVMLVLTDTPAFPVLFLSSVLIGAIATPINHGLNIDTVRYMINHLNINIVFIDKSVQEKFQVLRDEACVRHLEYIDDYINSFQQLSTKESNFKKILNIPTTSGNDFAYCLFSSGTTGKPKAIPHRHFDPMYCAVSYGESVLEMNKEDTVFSVAKLSFGYALVGVMLFSLRYGASMLLDPRQPDVNNVTEMIEMFKPTLFLGQPRMISDILKSNVDKDKFKSLRLVVTAGEVLSPVLFDKWFEQYNMEILDGFGSTEVGHIFISNVRGHISKGSLGKLLPGYEAKIIDEDGNQVEPQGPGKLCIRGDSLFKRYLNDEQKTIATIVDGWFVSNDVFKEVDGFYYFIGRSDDMIKTGCGEWISPVEIENVMKANDKVLDCAVVGYRDESNIIRIKALIASSIGPDKHLAEEVTKSVKNEWPDLSYKHLQRIDFVSSLPRSEAGKLLRNKLSSHSLTDFSYDC